MKKAAVIGNPVEHSLSPLIFRYWFETLGLEGNYEALQLDGSEIDAFLKRMRAGEFIGCNVTIPFKETVIQKLDTLDEAAKNIGAVNVITSESGKLEGGNTDWTGFLANLEERHANWQRNVFHALVLGAGGAARAVVFALLEKGVSVVIAGRGSQKTSIFAESFKSEAILPLAWPDIEEELPKTQLVVNTTPLGMEGFGEVAIDFTLCPQNAIAYDLVYAPANTGFLASARASGLKTVGGLGMLVHQAAPAFRAWFGEQPPLDENLYAILETELRNRR